MKEKILIINEEIVKGIPSGVISLTNILAKELIKNFNVKIVVNSQHWLNNNNTSTLLIAHTLDQVSVSEPHKFIDFFDQDFCVEFTGKDIYVNETKIIEHKDGMYKVLGSNQHV